MLGRSWRNQLWINKIQGFFSPSTTILFHLNMQSTIEKRFQAIYHISNLSFSKYVLGFPGGTVVKNSNASARDAGLIPGSRRYPGVENGNPFQYSCLGNAMDRGAWRATVHGDAKSQTRQSYWACILRYVLFLCFRSCDIIKQKHVSS